ncbi:MAG: hypothetical protein KGZ63_13585 [Clostridiales bacterium]|jgi:Flp pilus assembly pilin Flp|nr:hypothetical protein [Clostridiales bacterium]
MSSLLVRFLSEEVGQGMTEYALIISILALAVFIAMKVMGEEITNLLNRAVDALKNENAAVNWDLGPGIFET